MTNRRGDASSDHSVVSDPFTVPETTQYLADVAPRSHVVIDGTVTAADPVAWAGGPVLEVELADATDTICIVFFGRCHVGGLRPGRHVVATGTVGSHRGRRVILNPQIWLTPATIRVTAPAEIDQPVTTRLLTRA